MIEFTQQVINGIQRGSEYALWAVGFGLVFQVMGVLHFAFGEALLLGLYLLFTLVVTASLPVAIALPIVLVFAALLGVVVERVVYRPLVVRGQLLAGFVAALGAASILQNVIVVSWGRSPLVLPRIFPESTLHLGELTVSTTPFVVLGVALLVVIAFGAFRRRTRIGQAIGWVAEDRETAQLMGVNVARVYAYVYALSGVIGIVGAILFVNSFRTISITLGFVILLKGFIAAIIGGIGRLEGALLGGLLLGVIETLTIAYVSGVYVDVIAWSLLGVLLLVRPTGIMGRKDTLKL